MVESVNYTLSVHSVDVKHDPCPSSEVALHTSFENCTTLNNPRTEDFKIIIRKLDLQSKVNNCVLHLFTLFRDSADSSTP